MFADTLTITIDGVAKVVTKVNEANYSSEYRLKEATGDFRLSIRHSSYTDKKNGDVPTDRHNIELIHTIYGSAGEPNTVRKNYVVVECPAKDDATAVVKESVGFAGFLTSPNLTKALNWES